MRIAIIEGQVRTAVTVTGQVDSYTPPAPSGGPSLDFSDADNSMYLGVL